nr:MAG TPA: hypothetical protein [Caudoviricetes sp.]
MLNSLVSKLSVTGFNRRNVHQTRERYRLHL